jgi:hypothetical protein
MWKEVFKYNINEFNYDEYVSPGRPVKTGPGKPI